MRIIYNEFNKEILAVIEDENGSVTAFPPGSGVLQGSPESLFLQAVSIGLDVSQIPGAHLLTDRAKLLARLMRCRNTKLRFLEENLTVDITPEQSAQMLGTFINVILLLDNGDAKTALGAVWQMPAALFPITKKTGVDAYYNSSDERKQSYVLELQNIVTDLFE